VITASNTPTASPTATAIPATKLVGDCTGSGSVNVADVLTLVNVALGNVDVSACPYGVPGNADVNIGLILMAVNNVLNR
jgi:hypothetical protein